MLYNYLLMKNWTIVTINGKYSATTIGILLVLAG